MTHSCKVCEIQMFREEIQLVDLQAQIARLYLRVVFHIEWDNAFNQRGKPLPITKILLYYSRVIFYFFNKSKEMRLKRLSQCVSWNAYQYYS